MRSNRSWLPILVVLLVAAPVLLVGLTLGLSFSPASPLGVALFGWGALGLALGGLVWKIMDMTVLKAARRLAIEVAAATHGSLAQPLDPGRYPFLPVLPQAMLDLAGKLAQARNEVEAAVRVKTAELETERARLAAIVEDLHEGVVVCNVDHQMALYNRAAFELLGASERMGLGRSFIALVAADPVQHAFEMLRRRAATNESMPFIAGTLDGRALLQGRMSLVRTGGAATDTVSGYAVTFSDRTGVVRALAERDALIGRLVATLEKSVSPAVFAEIGFARTQPTNGWWPMSDVFSSDLFDILGRRVQSRGAALVEIGLPAWFHGDSHLLVLVLEKLLAVLSTVAMADRFDISAETRHCDHGVRLDWERGIAADGWREEWLASNLGPAVGGLLVRDALAQHGAVGGAILYQDDVGSHIELPLPPGLDKTEMRPILPKRPEFFDFDLLSQAAPAAMAERPLAEVPFVVFDTETTGLSPTQGDRIVSLAGVRVVNGRILTGEAFERLVDPQRPIPPESTKFHGITDETIKGKPPIAVVLPQFRAFVGDAVLVAHNAAFDLKFLRMNEGLAGVVFDNPVLDTMLLSTFVDGTTEGQSLDDIAARYGVTVAERHTALGDSLIAAAVLLRLIGALEAKGVRSLGEAMEKLDMTMQIHNRTLAQR